MTYRKKLIEVALPLEAINREAAREKSIRHGHPSTLHLWWARRPLAACRAVLFASLVDDPSECVAELLKDLTKRKAAERELKARKKLWDEQTALLEKAQAAGIFAPPPGPEPKLEEIIAELERERLFRIIEELVKWKNSNNEAILFKARYEIARSIADNLGMTVEEKPKAVQEFLSKHAPPVYDPFCGGGSIPLEAQRLGLEAHASDLNPVPVLITKALIEIPPKFSGQPPVNPESREKSPGTPPSLAASASKHKQWFSRNYLPHLDQPGLVQSITFRLHDSVPANVVDEWKAELKISEKTGLKDPKLAELREKIAAYEDAGHGQCHLKNAPIAELIENALLHFDGERYRLLAWCVMPNHVHVLIETWVRWPLAGVVHSWKSFTASEANKNLGRTGAFWFREYHDRFIRDDRHLAAVVHYIEQNPVKAGLVKDACAWKWSSASKKEGASRDEKEASRDAGAPRMMALPGTWTGAAGLAEDIRYYGKWMRDEAEKRIGHLYPKVAVVQEKNGSFRHATLEEIKNRASNIQHLTVIAWLWARTVASPNPVAKGAHVPLVRSFWLSTKTGKKAWVKPIVDQRTMTYQFEICTGNGESRAGTVNRNGGVCLLTGSPMPLDYIRTEGKAGRLGTRLMAIVAEGPSGRVYLPPCKEHECIAQGAQPQHTPETDLPKQALGFRVQNYGMTKHRHLFTNRQLVALTALCGLIGEARSNLLKDSGGDEGYANAVTTYLAFALSKGADYWSALCSWHSSGEKMRNTFGRQALPFVWDFADCNLFSDSTGNWMACINWVWKVVEALPASGQAKVGQKSADAIEQTKRFIFSTDPPYYDNVPYADLSDFFYVWLRRSLQMIYPQLLDTVLVPKAEELIAEPFRHGGKEGAQLFFERGMTRVFERMSGTSDPRFPTTIYYAFKQAEDDPGNADFQSASDEDAARDGGDHRVSTGWETFLQGLIDAGWQIDGTWPMRTELGNRMRNLASNALASSIVLVCRVRPKDAGMASRRDFLAALKKELPDALRHLQRGNIAPVDLAQAAIGPGMAVFSRYAKIIETDGSPMSVRTALSLINQTLDEVLAEQEGEFDADTRWALAWFDQFGFTEGPYGQAETLSTAKNTSVSGMVEADILAAKGGKVRLLKKEDLNPKWDPTQDKRLTIWEITHQLLRRLEESESAAAELIQTLGAKAEVARDLSYRLYTICERRKWPQDAIGYNTLVLRWSDVQRLAEERKVAVPTQRELI